MDEVLDARLRTLPILKHGDPGTISLCTIGECDMVFCSNERSLQLSDLVSPQSISLLTLPFSPPTQ